MSRQRARLHASSYLDEAIEKNIEKSLARRLVTDEGDEFLDELIHLITKGEYSVHCHTQTGTLRSCSPKAGMGPIQKREDVRRKRRR